MVSDALDAEAARESGEVRLGGVGPDDGVGAFDVPGQVFRVDSAHAAGAEDAESQGVRRAQ